MKKTVLSCVAGILSIFLLGMVPQDGTKKASPPYPNDWCECKVDRCPGASGLTEIKCQWAPVGLGKCECPDLKDYKEYVNANPKLRECVPTETGKANGLKTVGFIDCGDCTENTCETCKGCVSTCETRDIPQPNPDPCSGASSEVQCLAMTCYKPKS